MKAITSIILAILFCCPLSVFAQKKEIVTRADKARIKKNILYYNEIFGSKDSDFNITEAPEQYKDEPQVVLCQKTHIGFFRKSGSLKNQAKGVIRKRILIQDQAVLSNFSEFYYQESDLVGISVIKSDGTENKINLADAIKVTSDVPRFYADYYHSADYYKIAIPNLEVGDIIDYYKVFTETYQRSKQDIQMITPISYSYPIVHQEIIFDIGKKWSFYYTSLNGAPSFIEDPNGGVNDVGKKRKGIKRFILKDDFRETMPDERWDFTYRTAPIIKVMASLSKFSTRRITQKLNIGKQLSRDINEAYRLTGSLVNILVKQVKRSKQYKKKNAAVISDLAYVKLRQYFLEQSNYNAGEQEQYYSMKDNIFAFFYVKLLGRFKIKAEIVVLCPRFYGEVSEIITKQEIVYAAYVPAVDKYFLSVDNYLTPGELRQYYYGASCYRMSLEEAKRGAIRRKEHFLPLSNAEDNTSQTYLDITVKDDNSLEIAASLLYTGVYKNQYSGLFITKDIYSSKEPYDVNQKKKTMAKLTTERKEGIEKWMKNNFDIDSMDDFTLISSGRAALGDSLQADFMLTSTGYVKKAGRNLIFEVGKLISGQVGLEEEEINKRTKDIELGYARTIKNTFNIILPEGLTVRGIDKLAMNVDNAAGTFTSVAKQEGNVLSIQATKVYKQQKLPKAAWGNLVEMLEAAYKFSQLKVILRAEN